MQIDAREIGLRELLLKLKEILASELGNEVNIDVIISNAPDAKKVKTFVSMSGCRTEIEKKDNYYIMHARGIPCCA